MSEVSTVNAITANTLQYAPAVLAGIQAAEVARQADPTITGPQAQVSVVSSVLTGIEVGSGALESSPNATVASVAMLTNLFVSIFNSLGVFKHKAAA